METCKACGISYAGPAYPDEHCGLCVTVKHRLERRILLLLRNEQALTAALASVCRMRMRRQKEPMNGMERE